MHPNLKQQIENLHGSLNKDSADSGIADSTAQNFPTGKAAIHRFSRFFRSTRFITGKTRLSN